MWSLEYKNKNNKYGFNFRPKNLDCPENTLVGKYIPCFGDMHGTRISLGDFLLSSLWNWNTKNIKPQVWNKIGYEVTQKVNKTRMKAWSLEY